MGVAFDDSHYMKLALEQAELARLAGEVPIGAVLVEDNGVVGAGYNQPIGTSDPTAHAEIIALRAAAARKRNYRLPGTTLYVSLEPCLMCCGALVHARVARLVFAAAETRSGGVNGARQMLQDKALNHHVAITQGVLEAEAAQLIQDFFVQKRGNSSAGASVEDKH